MADLFNVYSIKDVKTDKFLSLELFTNDLECERFLKMRLGSSQDVISKFPDDFYLYRLGTFDVSNGNYIADVSKVCVISELFTPSRSGNEEK